LGDKGLLDFFPISLMLLIIPQGAYSRQKPSKHTKNAVNCKKSPIDLKLGI